MLEMLIIVINLHESPCLIIVVIVHQPNNSCITSFNRAFKYFFSFVNNIEIILLDETPNLFESRTTKTSSYIILFIVEPIENKIIGSWPKSYRV